MRRGAAGEVVPLDHALEPLAAAGADDIHTLAVGEDRCQDLITDFRSDIISRAGRNLDFAAHAGRRDVRLLEVADSRPVDLGRGLFHQAELHRRVAIGLRRLRLDDDAGTGLDDGGRVDRAVGIEHLRHADFSSDDSGNHKNLSGLMA